MKKRNLIPAAAVLCLLFLAAAFVVPETLDQKEPPIPIAPLPLPGQVAKDFELAAVFDNEIKKISLSDYRGKWVYLNFFPAAFTFV